MVSDSFAFKKTKSCRQHAFMQFQHADVEIGTFLTEWRENNRE